MEEEKTDLLKSSVFIQTAPGWNMCTGNYCCQQSFCSKDIELCLALQRTATGCWRIWLTAFCLNLHLPCWWYQSTVIGCCQSFGAFRNRKRLVNVQKAIVVLTEDKCKWLQGMLAWLYTLKMINRCGWKIKYTWLIIIASLQIYL